MKNGLFNFTEVEDQIRETVSLDDEASKMCQHFWMNVQMMWKRVMQNANGVMTEHAGYKCVACNATWVAECCAS